MCPFYFLSLGADVPGKFSVLSAGGLSRISACELLSTELGIFIKVFPMVLVTTGSRGSRVH